MNTTESSGESLSLDSAVALITEPETPETEDVIEEDVSQPEEDDTDDTEVESEDDGEVSEDDEEYEDDSEESEDEDEYEDSEEEPDQDEPETYDVKIDGEIVKVTLDDLKRDYSGQKYVQKGMQNAAEARKQAESVYAELMQERQSLAEIVRDAREGKLVPPKEPPRELFDQDPIGYMEAKMNYDDNMRAYQEKAMSAQRHLQNQSQAEERAKAQYMQLEASKLVERMPELKDPEKASKFRDNLLRGAQKHFGYTADQVAMVGSHQDLLTLNYAVKYAEMMANKGNVQNKVKKAKPAMKAGAKKTKSNRNDAQKAIERLRNSRSTEDALSILIDPNLR